MSCAEITAVRHRACSLSASGAQIRSARNSRRLRAASGDDEMACTMLTNACPGASAVSHWARNPATSRAPGESVVSATCRMISWGSAGSERVAA